MSKTDRQDWYPKIKIQIVQEEAFLGPGSYELLSRIHQTSSVRIASEEMNLSYTKAWKLMNTLEDHTGYPVIVRKKGGKKGGSSYLTEKGIELLNWYTFFLEKCVESVENIYQTNPPPHKNR